MQSVDMLGVHEYQAKASIAKMYVPLFNGTSCRLFTYNEYGVLNKTLKEG